MRTTGTMPRRAWRRRLASLLVVGLLAAGGALTGGTAAQAVTTRLTIGTGKASCPAGYVCLWTLNNFTGSGYAFYNSGNWSGLRRGWLTSMLFCPLWSGVGWSGSVV